MVDNGTATVRASSSIVLLREQPALEVFMVERPARGSFPGAHVFPGGVVDVADASADIYALCDGLDDTEASARLNLDQHGLAYYVAAIRETFEETGYLLARKADGSAVGAAVLGDAAADWREQLSSGRRTLLDLCRAFGVRPAVDRLVYNSYWLTPRSEKRRYATRFFLTSVPEGPAGRHDGAELVDSFWIAPPAALSATSGLRLMPPTQAQLGDLAGCDTVADATDAARERFASAGVACVFPQVSIKPDGGRVFSYAEYPAAPDPVEFAGARS
ncbi:MAG: hypothetical protein AAFN78_13355 [Pseudomonadota bacterium]